MSGERIQFENLKLKQIKTPKLFNREYLPRVCIDIKFGDKNDLFNVKLIFIDQFLNSQSSLLEKSYYELKLYNYNYKENLNYVDKNLKNLYAIDVHEINKPISPIFLSDMITFRNLKEGRYLLEVIF